MGKSRFTEARGIAILELVPTNCHSATSLAGRKPK